VITLGWFGSQERHVRKYANLWEDRLGVSRTFTFRPSIPAVFFPKLGQREARAFMDAVPQPRGHGELVVWHVLSQGGFTFFGTLLLLLESQRRLGGGGGAEVDEVGNTKQLRFSALVMDSGPCLELTPRDASAGTMSGLFSGLGILTEDQATQLYATSGAFKWAWTGLWSLYKSLWYDNWREEILRAFWRLGPVPQLYLYSAEDKIISCENIEAFIAKQREMLAREGRGGGEAVSAVSTRRWETGRHVNLLRDHPAEYEAALATFLDDLKKKGKRNEEREE